MSPTAKLLALTTSLLLTLISACNLPLSDDDACNIPNDTTSAGVGGAGSHSAGVGGSTSDPTTGDGETFAYCSESCSTHCPPPSINGFSPAVFKFVTIVPDDGLDEAGGWQAASANLKIVRWISLLPESWFCSVTVGMPLRTAVNGTIPPDFAATITAAVATDASRAAMSPPDVPQGIYCLQLKTEMRALFKARHLTIGAKVD